MKIVSWNVKGLRSPNKRMAILRHLKWLKTDIALLQETHLPSSDFWRMLKLWVGQTHGSASTNGKAGVVILIHKHLSCKVVSSDHDVERRLLTLHLWLSSIDLILTNIYAPNSPTNSFFQAVATRLAPYLEYRLLLGGDFNTIMDRQEDKHRGNPTSQSTSQPTTSLLNSFATALQLIDPWRLSHPEGREYLIYSPPTTHYLE